MLYVDTSILVAALSNEAHTAAAQDWLGGQRGGALAISDWTIAEMSSALAIKLRRRELSLAVRNEALALFNGLVEDSFQVLSVSALDFRTAARLADQHAAALRAGDALHLAIASNRGMTLYTLDKGLAKAAQVGINTVLIA